MAIFKYTLPSGSKFTVEMPDGTTQQQADLAFYEQVAAGTFVGYRAGDKLTTPAQTLTNFGLSRIRRGTAGVDDKIILSEHRDGVAGGDVIEATIVNGVITSGTPITTIAAGVPITTQLVDTIQNLPSVLPIPSLSSVPVENPVTQADVITVKTGLGPVAVGTLSAPEVQALMAQTVATVNQSYELFTREKGIGKYGFNAPQLERVGYIKLGTVDRYLGGIANNTFSNPENFVEIMKTPSIWTGKNNVTSVYVIIASDALQNKIYQELMQQSYAVLVATGAIVPKNTEATQPSVSVGQVFTPYQTLVAADPIQIVAAPISEINSSTSTTVNAVDAIPDGDISSLVNGAVAESNTASKSFMDSVNSINATINSVNADIAALVSTANKYGPAVASAWAKASGVLNGKITADTLIDGVKGQAEALVGNLKGQAEALVGNVKGQAEALVAQGKQAIDNLAKSAKSAVDFAQTKLSSLVTGIKKGAAFANSVDRTTVDTAVDRVIGSAKITKPTFEIPNLDSLGITKDIQAAQAQIASIQSQGQALVNQGQAIARQAQGTINGLQGQAQNIANNAQSQIRGLNRLG